MDIVIASSDDIAPLLPQTKQKPVKWSSIATSSFTIRLSIVFRLREEAFLIYLNFQDQGSDTPSCEHPAYPSNGHIRTDPPGKTTFVEGEYIYYECNANYKIEGEGRVGCFGGSWTHVPACRRKSLETSLNFKIGDEFIFECCIF